MNDRLTPAEVRQGFAITSPRCPDRIDPVGSESSGAQGARIKTHRYLYWTARTEAPGNPIEGGPAPQRSQSRDALTHTRSGRSACAKYRSGSFAMSTRQLSRICEPEGGIRA